MPEPLADALLDALPQTQCTRCGYPDCRGYADAIAAGEAAINRCPPGGAEGVRRLSRLTGLPATSLDPACGAEGPRCTVAIDEAWCIGCTLCLDACPVDCIVGAPRGMHTVIESLCTGCELCLPACPVDCIVRLPPDDARTGWDAWSAAQAQEARGRHAQRQQRRDDEERRRKAPPRQTLQATLRVPPAAVPSAAGAAAGAEASTLERKRSLVEAALRRARAARSAPDGAA